MDDGHIEYVVECIRDSRVRRGRLEYLVHWEGYPREEDTWEPANELKRGKKKAFLDMIAEFHRLHPSAPVSVRCVFCHADMTIRGG
jgi:hypothetical protein